MTGHIGKQAVAFPALCDRRVFTLLVIKQIGPPLRGRLILFITRMSTDRIGLQLSIITIIKWLPGSTSLYGFSR